MENTGVDLCKYAPYLLVCLSLPHTFDAYEHLFFGQPVPSSVLIEWLWAGKSEYLRHQGVANWTVLYEGMKVWNIRGNSCEIYFIFLWLP